MADRQICGMPWRPRYKLSLRDLPEMFLIRGIVFSHEAVRDGDSKTS
jgi:transposase-like protein